MPILNHREGDPLTRDVGTRLPKENVSVVCSIRARHVVGMLGARKTDGILLKASRILNDATERPEPSHAALTSCSPLRFCVSAQVFTRALVHLPPRALIVLSVAKRWVAECRTCTPRHG